MKVVVTGTRGIPNISGGVETHCENLYPLLVDRDVNIVLIRRSPYVKVKQDSYKGVLLKDIWSPKKKSIEAIIHTFLAVFYAKKIKADIIHIHSIGPAILVPLAKLLGLNVVVTHHSLNYFHKKWGFFAKFMLRSGEKFTAKYADEIIVISPILIDSLLNYSKRDNINIIFNGVNKPQITQSYTYIKSLGLESKKYILALGRFVEEKGFHNLIEVYSKSSLKNNFKLVIAGDADHETEYSKKLKQQANNNNVVLTGFIKEERLNEIMSHAALFVLPSFHEGLPISLLEAMSYELDVLVSNIPANLEIGLKKDDYFNPYDLTDFQEKFERKFSNNIPSSRVYDVSKYDWDNISLQTLEVYNKVYNKSKD